MKKLLFLIISATILSGCVEKPELINDQIPESGTAFDFSNTTSTIIQVNLADASGTAFAGVKVNLWSTQNHEKLDLIFTSFTNASGQINETLSIPSYLNEVIVETNFIGIPNNIIVPVDQGNILFEYANGAIQTPIIEISNTKGSSVGNLPGMGKFPLSIA